MKKFKENLLELLLLLSIPVTKSIYLVLNNPGRRVNSLLTDIDRGIPFIKEFIIPYIGWYFYIFAVLIYFCFKDRKVYHRTLITINLSLLVCYFIYIVFQTTVPRPVLSGNDIFTRLVGFIYSVDRPFNCFPSIHTMVSFILIKAVNKSTVRNRVNTAIITGISLSIIFSTFFVKQHVILDAIAAIFLGGLVFDLIFRVDPASVKLWLKIQFHKLILKKKLET